MAARFHDCASGEGGERGGQQRQQGFDVTQDNGLRAQKVASHAVFDFGYLGKQVTRERPGQSKQCEGAGFIGFVSHGVALRRLAQ